MDETTGPLESEPAAVWQVYLLQCADGSYYVGSTSNLKRRLAEHQEGRGARYTRGRGPLTLVAAIDCRSRSDAQQLEARIKRWDRMAKERLAHQHYQFHDTCPPAAT